MTKNVFLAVLLTLILLISVSLTFYKIIILGDFEVVSEQQTAEEKGQGSYGTAE